MKPTVKQLRYIRNLERDLCVESKVICNTTRDANFYIKELLKRRPGRLSKDSRPTSRQMYIISQIEKEVGYLGEVRTKQEAWEIIKTRGVASGKA